MHPKRIVHPSGVECETLVQALKWVISICKDLPYEPNIKGGCIVKSAIFKDDELIWEEDEAK